ncbi:unnamed protein product, partial [Ectocarpus sp. 12 AP-2014]
STRLPLIVDRDFCPRGMRSDDGSPPIYSFYTPSHHQLQLIPPEQFSPSKHRTSMPRHSRQASNPSTNPSPSTAGSFPPAASTAATTPPPARGAGSSASAGSSAGSPEQVPADRELQYLCPRTGCNNDLSLKENIRKDRADY